MKYLVDTWMRLRKQRSVQPIAVVPVCLVLGSL
jgi:hypothetical protein